MKFYKTKHAIREEYALKFILSCFIVFSLYTLGIVYTDNLKRSMSEAFTESVSELQDISKAFRQAEEMTLEIIDKKG